MSTWLYSCNLLHNYSSQSICHLRSGAFARSFSKHTVGEKRRRRNLKSSREDLGTYITPNYQNFLQPLQASPLFVRLTKYLQCHWRVYNACMPTWLAKTLLLFLPRWVLLHNGGLEGCGLRAGLPNKALVACSRQENVFASRLPKTNFREVFYVGCSGSSMTVWGLDRAGRAASAIRGSFVKVQRVGSEMRKFTNW